MTAANTQNQEHQGTTLGMILRSVERGHQDDQCGLKGDDLDFCLRRYFDYAESSTKFSSPRTRPTSPSMVGSSNDGMETQLPDEQGQSPQAYNASKLPPEPLDPPQQNEDSGSQFMYATRTMRLPMITPSLSSKPLLDPHSYHRSTGSNRHHQHFPQFFPAGGSSPLTGSTE